MLQRSVKHGAYKDAFYAGNEQEVKEESNANAIAELLRERQRNAELMQRISLLEAQLQLRNDQLIIGLSSNLQVSSPDGKQRRFRKFKRQKSETSKGKFEDQRIEMASRTLNMPSKDTDLENCPVNWMSMEDYHFFECEKLKHGDSLVDCEDDTDDIDDEIDENDMDHMGREDIGDVKSTNEQKEPLEHDDKETNVSCLENSSVGNGKPTLSNEIFGRGSLLNDLFPAYDAGELDKYDNCDIITSRQEFKGCGSGNLSLQKKPSKVAFCPKEVRRIFELEELLLENAQSHTIRKIIVFASLGIRHGSEEMYELDFNHFRILQKGEPYLSSKNPGEHVVYKNPGIRRKVFYPNRKNPTLCPVRILEEEEGMRPSDAGCPSFLFLCIKYGGSTRNLPQNEYVRQRMGRNKLKSFGPFICRMAMLAHIRSGSFFFKALGITLLFMAGFPDDLVRKETNYRNLDLLQKYYRLDEDAEGEELFLSHPTASDSHHLPGKTFSKKFKGKKWRSPITKLDDSTKLAKKSESAPSTSSPPTQFGLMGYTGYTSIQAQTMTSIQSMPPQTPITSPPVSHPNISYTNQSSYPNFPPHLPNSFLPMIYWPPSTAPFQPCYPYSYNYRSFPSTGNYFPIQPHTLYSHASSNPLIPRIVKGIEKNNSDSNSSSSSTEPKDN